MDRRVGVVVVSFGHASQIERLLKKLKPQLKHDDRLVIVDNKPPHNLKSELNAYREFIVEHDNGGFGAGCNYGASKLIVDVDIILLLNPDTWTQQDNYIELMRSGKKYFSAWQSLLLLPDGSINSAGNVYHVSGLSWVGSYGISTLPVSNYAAKSLSGACLAITSEVWRAVGGFTEDYFMYGEDVDLSLKVLMHGGKLGVVPKAHMLHDYEFEKGDWKWKFIERNRLVNILVNWPILVIIFTFLPNLLFNIVIFTQYLFKGRGMMKLKSDLDFVMGIPTWLRLRSAHRKLNTLSDCEFVGNLEYKLSSPYLGGLSRSKVLEHLLGAYYRTMRLFFR